MGNVSDLNAIWMIRMQEYQMKKKLWVIYSVKMAMQLLP